MKAPDRIWAVFDKHEQGGLPRVYATAEKTKGVEYVRAVLTAAQPRVKPLEWVWSKFYSTWTADSIFGDASYRAWVINETACVVRPSDFSGVIVGKTVDDAKAAAQADYESRILSALEIPND